MSTYHVYLPPTTLIPLDGGSIPRLTFQKPDPPHGTSQQSWSHLSIRSNRPHPTLANSGRTQLTDQSQPQVDASTIKRDLEDDASKSRVMGVKRSRGPLRKTQPEVSVDTSRRRSTRLGRRTSGELPHSSMGNIQRLILMNRWSDWDVTRPRAGRYRIVPLAKYDNV